MSQAHQFEPYRPVFFPHALLCRATTKGAIALKTTVKGGRDENFVPRVAAAALYQRDTGISLLLVNDGFEPKRVTVRLARRVPGRAAMRLAHLSYDAALPATFRAHPELVATNGQATLTLPPRSVHALSTRADFAKVAPLPPMPPRDEPAYSVRTIDGRKEQVALMGFNADYEWRVWQSTAGHTKLATAPERGNAQNKVCRITYELVGVPQGERAEHVVAHTDLLLNGRPRRIACRIKGDGKGHKLSFLFLDAKGEVFEMPHRTRADWTGWRRVEKSLDGFPDDWDHWSGDGKVDYPLCGFGLVLTSAAPTATGRGILALDDVEITAAAR